MFGVDPFRNLTARPPTPPRDTKSDEIEESLDQAIDFLNSDTEVETTLLAPVPRRPSQLLETPEATPATSTGISSTLSKQSSAARKVNFAPFVQWEFHNSPVHPPTVTLLPVKHLPPSRERPSTKSILRPFKMVIAQPTSRQPRSSLQKVLEETVDALRTGDIASRVNAYGLCLHALQNLDSFPDAHSITKHGNNLLQYIRRDMETEATSDPNHSKLAISAIKLFIALIRIPESTSWFEADRLAAVVECSVSMVQSATAPKSILTHHLFLLSQQKFPAKIMTPDRVSRTIAALMLIHDKIPGTGVRAHRLLIYRRFVEQAPTVMRARASDWIVNLYTSMLSQKKEVREQGIDLGFITSSRFGGHSDISRFVQELLDKESQNKTFGSYAIGRLQELLKSKDICVPKVWAITVLFLRGRNRKEHHWNWFKPWLELASSCVNSPDKAIKAETINQWRKLIFACMPDMQTLKPVRNLLKAPIEAHLRKEKDHTKGLGLSAMMTYYCLLHYSLRPGLPFEQYDSYWDEHVADMLSKLVSETGDNVFQACELLQSLCRPRVGAKTTKSGEESLFDFEDPPLLEPRWIRSRLNKVLSLLTRFLVLRVTWEPIDDERLDNDARGLEHIDSLGMITWMVLMDAVREAGRIEVTTSLELKSAIASIVNSLHHLAQAFRKFDNGGFHAIKVFTSLVKGTLERLGPSHFAERLLLRNSSNGFEVAPTPSQRAKSGGSIISPMTHLFLLQLSITTDRLSTNTQVETIRSTTLQCWNSLKTRGARLDLLGDLSEALESFKLDKTATNDLLQEIADLVLELAEETVLSNSTHLVAQPSMSSADITALLRITDHLVPFLNASRIPKILYAHIIKGARAISGDGSVLLLVTEPQSAAITNWMTRDVAGHSEMLLSYASLIVNNDTRPRLGSMERARKQIWGGVSNSSEKFNDADLVHTNIWGLFETSLRYGYAHLGDTLSVAMAFSEFVGAMQQHIGRSLRSFHTLVRFTQKALTAILLDEERRLKDISRTAAGSKLLSSILALWMEITDKYRHDFKTTNPASNWLETVQDLILAGFHSPRESIVNVTICFWNDFVDQATELMLDITYPEKLIDAALCLRSISDVHLPPDYADKENEQSSEARTFVAFSDYGSQPSMTPLAVRAFGPPNHVRIISPMPPKPDSSRTKSPTSKNTPRRKLRHEDSQIIFEPIATSSPVQAAEETQNFTDHQKEVLERQRDEAAAMFRDIGSDEVSSQSGNKLIINSDIAVVSSDSGENDSRPTTPNFDLPEAADDEVPSSPITASQSRRRNRSSSSLPKSPIIEEVPSSPPLESHNLLQAVLQKDIADTEEPRPDTIPTIDDVEMPDLSHETAVVIPETVSDSQSGEVNAVAPDQATTDEDGAKLIQCETPIKKIKKSRHEISSEDDLPSSQLVAEMMASQSSPIKPEDDDHGAELFETSQITVPEQSTETQSTESILRGQKTLADIYHDSSSHTSTSQEQNEVISSLYGTRSLSRSRAAAASQSQANEKAQLKRKRGRPRKDTMPAVLVPEDSMNLRRTARSVSRSSKAQDAESDDRSLTSSQSEKAAKDTARYTLDNEMTGRIVQRSGSQSSITEIETRASKRRKSDNGNAPSVPEDKPEATSDHDDEETVTISEVVKPVSAQSIMARLKSLLADAKKVTWGREERLEMSDLAFELQAATRGVAFQG